MERERRSSLDTVEVYAHREIAFLNMQEGPRFFCTKYEMHLREDNTTGNITLISSAIYNNEIYPV